MKLLLFLLRASRTTVVLALLASLVSGACGAALLALIHQALRGEGSPLSGPAVFLGVALLAILTSIASQVLVVRLGQGALCQLCVRLSRRILDVPLRRLEEVGSHRLLAVLTGDVPRVAEAFLALPLVCINVALLLGCTVYLAWLSPALFLGVLVFALPGLLSFLLLDVRAQKQLLAARMEQNAIVKHFNSLIEGVKELKIHGPRREAFLDRFLEATAAAVRDRSIAGLNLYVAVGGWGQLLIFGFIAVLLFVLPGFILVGPHTLNGVILVILCSLAPLEFVLNWLPVLGRARVATENIEALGLSLGKEEKQAPDSDSSSLWPSSSFERLELVGVTHTYRREREGDGFILGPIDLTLRPGEVTFLVGGNGSGKTTLAKLLTGLYSPEQGEVRLDDQVITAWNREQYRQLFSCVFAEAFLFDSLVGLNAERLDDQARDYLRQLELDHKVQVHDGVLSTTDLSRGQRKRLALLTAYLEDRPVYLFDEWASDQDPQFKKVFYVRILPELKARGKAVVVITHDERYFPLADRVVKLEDGRLVGGAWREGEAPASPSRHAPLARG